MAEPDADWLRVEALDTLPDGKPRWCRVDGRELVLVRQGEHVFALDDSCPHAGASLAGGSVDGRKLRCPAHGLQFDLVTGQMGSKGLAVACHATRVSEGIVFVRPRHRT